MELFREEPELTDIRMVQRVMDMFEGRSQMQRIVNLGLLGMEYDELDDMGEDDYDSDSWGHGYNHFRGYPRLADTSDSSKLAGDPARSNSSAYQPQLQYWTAQDFIHQHRIKVQPKESNTERKARLLQETKKSKEKAQKKRLKKQKQKERKRLEKLGKEKTEEEKDEAHRRTSVDNASINEKSKESTNSSVKKSASAEYTDSSESSEDDSGTEDSDTKNDSGDSEDLDMTSTFVRLAKLKLEQKPKAEKREKKKVPVKEACKLVPDKSNEDQEFKMKANSRSPTIEDNIKTSTELAIAANTFASSGDYNKAVKYFTDAIKFNPTEFKLFGNRSFCFEKLQEYEKALTDAELCLGLRPGWIKGLFRKGRALAGLKRCEEAAQAFRAILQLDSACAEAAQELMRVQITHLMEYGFTREQSSNALIIHGTVKKALEVLTKLNPQPGTVQNASLLPAQVANVTGVSPVLSANKSPVHACPWANDAAFKNKPLGPVQNMSNVHSQPKSIPNQATTRSQVNQTPLELFPVWVGNLVYPVSESMIANLFKKVGFVYSVKVLTIKRCAFVNFTEQEHCDEAIRRFHGFELNGMKLAVRYPDRIPCGMGISKSALKADDLQDENMRQKGYGDERNAVGGRRPFYSYRHVPDYRDDHKN